jgi:hypothetical protein
MERRLGMTDERVEKKRSGKSRDLNTLQGIR